MCALPHFQYANCSLGFVWYGDSGLLYYLIREIKMWLNINHITLHSNAYCGGGGGGGVFMWTTFLFIEAAISI